jgi:Leucine-rich repeat (LRR) protein
MPDPKAARKHFEDPRWKLTRAKVAEIKKLKNIKKENGGSKNQDIYGDLPDLGDDLLSILIGPQDPKKTNSIEVKNENELTSVDGKVFSKFPQLFHLSLNMNALTSIDIPIEASKLQDLSLSQNKIAKISPKAFSKLTDLRTLTMDVNLIEKIDFLDNCPSLKELNLSNNRVTTLEGLQKLRNLRKIELYRNRIKSLEGIEKWSPLIEYVDLGRNEIENIEVLSGGNILPLLVDLTLYFNKIKFLPKKLSF